MLTWWPLPTKRQTKCQRQHNTARCAAPTGLLVNQNTAHVRGNTVLVVKCKRDFGISRSAAPRRQLAFFTCSSSLISYLIWLTRTSTHLRMLRDRSRTWQASTADLRCIHCVALFNPSTLMTIPLSIVDNEKTNILYTSELCRSPDTYSIIKSAEARRFCLCSLSSFAYIQPITII